jgi:hypothetical protein
MQEESGDDDRAYVMSYVSVEEDDGIDRPIDAERILREQVGRVQHDVWRVTTAEGRAYWVVTNPTGSYDASRYDKNDALHIHVGLNVILTTRDGRRSPY